MGGDFFGNWSKVIKEIPLSKRERIWDEAMSLMRDEGDLEPTMQKELTQHQIQSIILDRGNSTGVHDLFIDFAVWIKEGKTEIMQYDLGNELWLHYLMERLIKKMG